MSNKKAKSSRKEKRSPSLSGSAPTQSSRYKAIFLKVVFMAVSLAIFGFAINAYRNYMQPVKPLHAFTAKERSAFTDILKAGGVPSKSVWLACSDGKPETCELVKQFLSMFQESGWKVEDNRVITWTPAHPLQGVHLIVYSPGESDAARLEEAVGVKNSFTAIGIPVETVSAPDVPRNSIGIYFGPDL